MAKGLLLTYLLEELRNRGDYMYCQVCGHKINDKLLPGMICSCCGYEYTVDDYITLEQIYAYSPYMDSMSATTLAEIEELGLQPTEEIPIEYAHQILRAVWIKGGCQWKYTKNEREAQEWNIDKARKQLQNIGINQI